VHLTLSSATISLWYCAEQQTHSQLMGILKNNKKLKNWNSLTLKTNLSVNAHSIESQKYLPY
jgi:hypothetical protein